MNRHAEKPLKGSLPAELLPLDENNREVIAEIHCCPGCGKVEATVDKDSGRIPWE